jgi:hypothetical protein
MSKAQEPDLPPQSQFLVYRAEDGQVKIDVRLENETVWLTQQHMADLFQTTQQNISLHLQNIYDEGELQRMATHKEILSVRQEGSRQLSGSPEHYSLDAIISVVRKDDVTIAKNYLNEPELAALNNLVEQYLVFAAGQAMRRVPMHMQDWIAKLHGFLTLNDRNILRHAGQISHQIAKELAEAEYEKFNQKRIQQADAAGGEFEKAIKQLPTQRKRGGKI